MSYLVTFEFSKKFNEEEKQKEKDNFYWRNKYYYVLCYIILHGWIY